MSRTTVFMLLPVYVLLLVVMSRYAMAEHIPGSEKANGLEGAVRIFTGTEKITFMGEAVGGYLDEGDRHIGIFGAGPYVRAHENLLIGAFYRLQRGIRHDDDWIWRNAGWEWKDVTSRNEHLGIGDITPRFLAGFLPGKNWVFELKTRYLYNFTNDEQTITVRPGLMFYLFRDGIPFINFYLQYELYFPLNYGVTTIYEQWAYAGAIYHVSASVQLGVYGAYKRVTWGPSEDVDRLFPDEEYKVSSAYFIAGMMAIIRIKM